MTAPASSTAAQRPTTWWLSTLERRRTRMSEEYLDLREPIAWRDEAERRAAIKFFNAAFRAEESGLTQAHQLAGEVRTWDPNLARVLELYGDEEGWHRELLTEFLAYIGGSVQPMGRVTRVLYRLYGRAKRMESIVLTNLMFETIGSVTYRLALRRVSHASARQMLTILTRDEAFHVPLNVHFLRQILDRRSVAERKRLRKLYLGLFLTLSLLPMASRPKARHFDHIPLGELMHAYAEHLARLFSREHDLGLTPPAWLLALFGVDAVALASEDDLIATSIEAAERAAEREQVSVRAL